MLKKSQAAKPPSPGTTKNPPLLVWIAWTRPQLTKHLTVALDAIPVGGEAEDEKDVKREFMKGSLYRCHAGFEGSQVVRYMAPRGETESAAQSNLAPVLVVAFGSTTYDIALAVLPDRPGVPAFDPKQKELWRDPKHYAGTPPGFYSKKYKFEIIPKGRLLLIPRPIPGVSYRIYYKVTRGGQKEGSVRGQLSYSENTWRLPVIKLDPGRGAFAGSFRFDEEGSLFFSAPNAKMQEVFRRLNRKLQNRLEQEKSKKAKVKGKQASGGIERASGKKP